MDIDLELSDFCDGLLETFGETNRDLVLQNYCLFTNQTMTKWIQCVQHQTEPFISHYARNLDHLMK